MWIEITWRARVMEMRTSQPARAVWIEIIVMVLKHLTSFVTACEGCVD